jgi:anti-anti-sigma factor
MQTAPPTARTFTTPDGVTVELAGQADLNALSILHSAVVGAAEETLAVPGHKDLTVDLRQVDYIDSAGLSVLVAAAKALTPASGHIRVLVADGGQPDRALRLVRFDAIMAIVRSSD